LISLILAEEQTMVRQALAALLTMNEDLHVLGQASDGQEAVQMVMAKHPDLCLLDVEMPNLNGLEAAEQIKQQLPECKVIILTTLDRPGYLRKAMKAGVEGYLLKDAPASELAKAIRQVASGARVISPELAWQRL
jgi:two-component system response regulator DesR